MNTRVFKVLPKHEQNKLTKVFPSLEKFHYHGKRFCLHYADTKELLKTNNYKWLYISIYDHWLRDDNEADKGLLEEFFKYCDEDHPKSYLLSNFNIKLFNSTPVLNFRPIGKRNSCYWFGRKEKISFRKFLSLDSFKSVSGTSQNYLFPYLVLPDFQAIYFPGKDLTHLLVYRDEKLLDDLKKWVSEAGLHILT